MIVKPLSKVSGQLCKCKSGVHWQAAAQQKWFVFDGESDSKWHVVSWEENAILGCINGSAGCRGAIFPLKVRYCLKTTMPAVLVWREMGNKGESRGEQEPGETQKRAWEKRCSELKEEETEGGIGWQCLNVQRAKRKGFIADKAQSNGFQLLPGRFHLATWKPSRNKG